MATEVTTSTWCDRHLAHDERVPGEALDVTLDGEPQTLDACAECADELVGPLRAALAQYGREAKRKPGRPRAPELRAVAQQLAAGGLRCPMCGHVSPNRAALLGHLKGGIHRLSGVEAARLLPSTQFPSVETPCPVAGCDFVGANKQGTAAHLAAVHDIRGLDNVPEGMRKQDQ